MSRRSGSIRTWLRRSAACRGLALAAWMLAARPVLAGVCIVPDAGGTAQLPPDCTTGYLSPDDVHEIIDGLPPGTTIEVDGQHFAFADSIHQPGGILGGEREVFFSSLKVKLRGTGALLGLDRTVTIPAVCETHVAPRTLFDPVQSFETLMYRLEGEIVGDPDFDLLRITAGTVFGMPSPGHTTLTLQPDGDWAVYSWFDVHYRIDFVGAAGGALDGLSGSTESVIRMQAGEPEIHLVNFDIEEDCVSQRGCALGDTVWIADWGFGTGPCAPSGWLAGGLPNNGRLIQHPTENDKCAENLGCAWLFTDPALPACTPANSWPNGGVVVPPGLDDFIVSPWVSLASTPSATGTVLQYRNFPGNSFTGARIVLNWSVRTKAGASVSPWMNQGEWTSLSVWSWLTSTAALTADVDGAATDVQVRFRVADWGPPGFACATSGTDCGPAGGPYLDRIRIGRRVITGPVFDEGIDSRSQAQDAFPAAVNGITPGEHHSPTTSRFGTAPMDRGGDLATCGASPSLITGDSIHVRVVDQRLAGGLTVGWCGSIVAGPHAGKAPPGYSVSDNGFFCVTPDSVRTPDGSIVQDHYCVDLDDTYFRGGDVLQYYWHASDAGGGWSSDPCGLASQPASVPAAEAATGGLFEASFLPTIDWSHAYLARIAADPNGDLDPTVSEVNDSSQRNCILYVQMLDSRRRSGDLNRTAFMHTLDRLGYRGSYDVYDIQGFGNTNNHLGGRATVAQATGYALIVQDAGHRRSAVLPDGLDQDSEKVDQAGWYRSWLANGVTSESGTATLWLIGDNVLQAKPSNPLLTTDFGVVLGSADQGLAVNPDVQGVGSFTAWNGSVANFATDLFALNGGCPRLRDYDGIAPTTGTMTHRYKSGAIFSPYAAVVMNKNVALHWNTVLSAFSWCDVRDPFGGAPGLAEMNLAGRILNCTLPVACLEGLDPVDVDPAGIDAPAATVLHQNVPNPFNPVTTIEFDLARDGRVKLQIFDVSGRLVRTLADAWMTAGRRHRVSWNATDELGQKVASGIYVYSLVTEEGTRTRRMVLLK